MSVVSSSRIAIISSTAAFRREDVGATVTSPSWGGKRRVVRWLSPTCVVTAEVLPWHRALWRHLSTAPNGDATGWMR